MKRETTLKHEFVEHVPRDLKSGTVYVSVSFATVIHKCCCGCGNQVVTPLSPAEWSLVFDGQTISLYPSIGNWGFPCQSHYWIRNNMVIWASRWSKEKVAAGRRRDEITVQKYFAADKTPEAVPAKDKVTTGRWHKFKEWFRRK